MTHSLTESMMQRRIEHLAGRDKLLAAVGWPDAEAEWIALVCLHSGVFTRRQFEFHFSANPATSFRFVKKLTELGFAKEEILPTHERNTTKACLLFAKAFYRTIGTPTVHYRRLAAPDMMIRRLLSLDYVIENLDIYWLPSEEEKVGLMERLGFDREILPQRLYQGAVENTVHYFSLRLPIGLRAKQRQFVFVYVDQGNQTDTELRHWGVAHEKLWNAMRARKFSVHVVGIGRTIVESTRASTLLRRWALEKRAGGILGKGRIAELNHELREITRGVEQDIDSVLSRYGGSIGAIARYGEIENILENRPAHHVRIDTCEIWNSRRVVPRAKLD